MSTDMPVSEQQRLQDYYDQAMDRIVNLKPVLTLQDRQIIIIIDCVFNGCTVIHTIGSDLETITLGTGHIGVVCTNLNPQAGGLWAMIGQWMNGALNQPLKYLAMHYCDQIPDKDTPRISISSVVRGLCLYDGYIGQVSESATNMDVMYILNMIGFELVHVEQIELGAVTKDIYELRPTQGQLSVPYKTLLELKSFNKKEG